MRRLNSLAPDPAYIDRYVAIRNRKRGTVRPTLVAAHPFVVERYLAFATAVAAKNLHTMTIDARGALIQDALRACYDGSTQPLGALKLAIRGAQAIRARKYCPMCGTTVPTTFDHYLPAVRFPELAVHALNLVPCCSSCNSIKDDDWLSAAGHRQYLHAFSDDVPELQFLAVTLYQTEGLSGVGAIFKLSRPEGISDEVWSLIESHFVRLKLLDRYAELSNDEIAEILSDCNIFIANGGVSARAFLAQRAQERSEVHGGNHWRARLMAALAEHPDFEQWLQVWT
jgi:5-methylcytosine-specific restriction endonuclease McrA